MSRALRDHTPFRYFNINTVQVKVLSDLGAAGKPLRVRNGMDRQLAKQIWESHDFITALCAAGKYFVFAHPHASAIWTEPVWGRLRRLIDLNCIQIGSVGEVWCMANFTLPVTTDCVGVTDVGLSLAIINCLIDQVVAPQVHVWAGKQCPAEPESRARWVQRALQCSTKGFRNGWSSMEAAALIADWLDAMRPGDELKHLLEFYNSVDLRASDVRLDTSTVLVAGRQSVPYPAFAWQWEVRQAYLWSSAQHINVLELIACFDYIRSVACRNNFSRLRLFHIVDSMVSAAVLAKGRSSSRVLNRVLRRVNAVLLLTDLYVLPVWTLSGWNFSDAGSRLWRATDYPDATYTTASHPECPGNTLEVRGGNRSNT